MQIETKGIDFENIGLDSSMIICLAYDSRNLDEFKKDECKFDRKFYFSVESEAEVIGILINKYSFVPDNARAAWERVSEEIGLNLIRWGEDSEKKASFFDTVKEINKSVSKIEKDPLLIIGDMDIRIISSFYQKEIKKVYTLDKAFKKTCNVLEMETPYISKKFIR